ncbi:hypothetical protein BKA65DRAFT_534440 [Rhexocercosporidium sp. MPI-PUGE-AT-0058]|nr:hypothetical protein BKA65DRAFT_534440 [Rhexocercosporidium sp. MPI-PUGE-AT-0058]
MGLPLFITPVEPAVASKAAEKIAAGPRSSIRRQRTLRGPHARLTAEVRRRRILGLMPEAEPEEFEVSEGQQGNMLAQVELPSPAALQMRAFRMVEQERMRMRDPLSFERQHPSNPDVDGPLMPPVPESRDYSVAEERHREIYRLRQVRQDLRRMARRHPAPTPPYTDSDLAFLARTDSPRLSSSLTPVLSPSHQPSTNDMDSPPRRPLEEADFSFTARVHPYTDSIGRPTLSERAQALNRTASNIERSRRLIRQVRQVRLDGLGDRDRSLSPDGGAAWETLLTSITPDPQPPSAGSSFASTSAAAAAASSSSGSGQSSASASASASTSMTSLDRNGEHECDVSDSGSNTEDEEEDIYELQEISGSRGRGDRFWRTYADVVTARADRAARQDGDLGGMHRIISRLARRDEIPQSWWASAGLSRNLRQEPSN